MKAIVDVNRRLLEKVSNQPVIKVWLEKGSIIFKVMITNPSEVISQTVPLKYYLPKELKERDVIEMDQGLELKYDPEKEVFFFFCSFELKPKETKIFSVRTADVWQISDEEVESLRNQAEELFGPLRNTAYFGQGASLKADINAALDKIVRIQKEAQTPEAHILAYREALEEKESIEAKIDSLKELLAASGASTGLLGSIAGINTTGTWGIILVVIVGIGFLAGMFGKRKKTAVKDGPIKIWPWLILLLSLLGIGFVIFRMSVAKEKLLETKLRMEKGRLADREEKLDQREEEFKQKVLAEAEKVNYQRGGIMGWSNDETQKEVAINVLAGQCANLRQEATASAEKLTCLAEGVFPVLDKIGQWYQIEVDSGEEPLVGWIFESLVEEVN